MLVHLNVGICEDVIIIEVRILQQLGSFVNLWFECFEEAAANYEQFIIMFRELMNTLDTTNTKTTHSSLSNTDERDEPAAATQHRIVLCFVW